MKALTLTQPWASLVASGAKRFETRSWNTNYRGPLAIHAAKGFPKAAKAFSCDEFVQEGIQYRLPSELPRGGVLCVVELVDVMRVDRLLNEGHGFTIIDKAKGRMHLPAKQYLFGDFGEGRYAWLLGDVRRFDDPHPATGRLGLWDWTPEMAI